MEDIDKRVAKLAEDAFCIMRDLLRDAERPLDVELNVAICDTTLSAFMAAKIARRIGEKAIQKVIQVRLGGSSAVFKCDIYDGMTVFDVVYQAVEFWGLDDNAGYNLRPEFIARSLALSTDISSHNSLNFVLVQL